MQFVYYFTICGQWLYLFCGGVSKVAETAAVEIEPEYLIVKKRLRHHALLFYASYKLLILAVDVFTTTGTINLSYPFDRHV